MNLREIAERYEQCALRQIEQQAETTGIIRTGEMTDVATKVAPLIEVARFLRACEDTGVTN